MLHDLLTDGMRATSAADSLARVRYMESWGRLLGHKEIAAIRADRKHLAAMDGQRAGKGATTERRKAVEALLSNVDTRGLADREIARRVGVSPQMVGNTRRRLARIQRPQKRDAPKSR